MKKRLILFLIGVLSVVSLHAQFAKPLRSRNYICRNTSSLSLGITGSFAANDMLYSAVSKSKLTPYLAPTFGLAAEWNTMRRISIGLDASYAMRGTNEVFATEFLTGYHTTTFARVNYSMTMNGVEIRMPFTYYIGYGENFRPYLYVAPRFTLWLNGNVKWGRTYDDNSYAPLVYESELNKATIAPYDISAVAGVGLCARVLMQRTRFFVKLDVAYGIGLGNFSPNEVNAANAAHDESAEATENPFVFHGWGDIEHETLGTRYLQNVEARLTFLVPLRKPLKDACAFDQKMRKSK